MFMDDASCMLNADLMSCQTMRGMAAQEYQTMKEYQNYMLHDDSCKRFHHPPNRVIESKLQYTQGSFKDTCLDPSILTWQKPGDYYTLQQDGPWIQQHTLLQTPMMVRFDQWTKAKTQTGSQEILADGRVPSMNVSNPNRVVAANDSHPQLLTNAMYGKWDASPLLRP